MGTRIPSVRGATRPDSPPPLGDHLRGELSSSLLFYNMQDPTHDSPSSRSSDLHGPISHAGRKGLRSLPLFWWMLHGLYPARRPARPSRPPFKAVLQREDRRDQPGGNHKGVQAAEEAPRLAAKPPPNTTPNARGGIRKQTADRPPCREFIRGSLRGQRKPRSPCGSWGGAPISPSLRTRPAIRRAGTRPPTGKT